MKTKNANLYMIMVIITLLLEIFVFNFRFIEGFKYKPIEIANFNTLSGIEKTGVNTYKVKSDGDKEIEMTNINKEVKNIYIDIFNKKCFDEESNKKGEARDFQKVAVVISMTDKGNKNYLDLPERFVVQGVERTKYIKLETTGESEKLKLRFNGCDNQELIINSIVLNKRVPFSFNILRVGFVFCIIWLLYTLRRGSKVYDIKVNDSNIQSYIVLCAIIVNIAICAIICVTNPRFLNRSEQYDDLAQAFMKKQVYLEEEPPEALINMDNPYDKEEREQVMRDNGTSAKWDHAYYNGKYYVYFGALPALVYYIPYRSSTDKPFQTAYGVLINACFFVVFSYLLIRAIVKRWFKNIPFVIYLILCQAAVFSSGIIFGLRKADLYSMPITMGLALTVMGLYFWVSVYKSKKKESKILRYAAGSLFMALVSACRPQMLMMSFIAIPLFWNEVFKERTLFSKKNIGDTIAFVLPYIIVASVVMWYNYARFGSVFDFGANYNLTTNDMTARGFKLDRLPFGVFVNFLQPPVVYAKFPFVTGVNQSNFYMGVSISEYMCGGIIATQPLLWCLFMIKYIKKELSKKGLFAFLLCLPVFSVIIGIADAQMAGLLCRYYMDFSYPMIIAAIIAAFTIYEKFENKNVAYCITVLGSLSLLFDFAEMFMIADFGHEYANPNFYYAITSALTFWM